MTICLALAGIGDHLEGVAHFGQRIQAQHFGGHGRFGFAQRLAAIVEHGAHLAEYRAADEIIAHMQRSVAHQHGGHGAAPAIELRFEHRADGRAIGIGLEVLQVGHQQNHFQQQIEIGLGPGGNGNHHDIAAPILRQQTTIGQLLLDALGLGVRPCRFC